MSNQDYAELLFFPNISIYFFIFVIITACYLITFKNNIYSWLDPFLLGILFSSAGLTTVFFLYSMGKINDNYFLQTLLSQLMLMIGYKTLSRNEKTLKQSGGGTYSSPKIEGAMPAVFVITSLLFILAQSSTYIVLGIPLLMDNRLMIYQSGGFGIFGRIVDVTFVISFYTFLDMKLRFKIKRSRELYSYLYILFLIASLVLNGSKSGILNLVFIVGVFCYINNLKFGLQLLNKYSKVSKKLLLIAIVAMFIILMANYGVFSDGNYSRIFDLFGVIFLRIFNSGDIYVLSYPHDALFNITNHYNGFVALFKDILATFRFITPAEMPPPLGNVAFNIYSDTEIGGANARQSLFGYYYFGFFGSLIFSFFIGMIMSFVRHVLPRMKKATPFSMGVICYFILNYSFLDIDPSYQFSKITNFLIVVPTIIFIMFFITKRNSRSNV